jgi:hypothetical protein
VKVDWSLDAPIPWTADDARRAGTVHVADVGGDDDGARALGSDSPRDLLQPRAAACQ